MVKRITINELAVRVKNGLDSIESRMATKDDLKAFATKDDLKAMEARLRQDLTETIYTEVGKVNLRIDKITLPSELNRLDK